jgi:hypothetical protein
MLFSERLELYAKSGVELLKTKWLASEWVDLLIQEAGVAERLLSILCSVVQTFVISR